MILVYTNSKERAMIFATILGGVAFEPNGAQFKTLSKKQKAIGEKLTKDGYLSTFFRGEPYVIVYTQGNAYALAKMSDYNASYATLPNRPIPFFPEKFEYRIIDPDMESKIEMYRKMFADAIYVINAATDDMSGELAFFGFHRAMGKLTTVMRVRPQTMDAQVVVEAFNSPEEGSKRAAYELACQLRERLDWLVSCNISNYLCRNAPERTLLVSGRLETLLLTMLAEKNRAVQAAQKHQTYKIEVVLRHPTDGDIIAEHTHPPFDKLDEATSLAGAISATKRATVVSASLTHYDEQMTPLLNMFTLEIEAGKLLGLTAQETNEVSMWLFDNGFITWPSASSAIPWRIKTLFTSAITTLAQQEKFQKRILPRDIDTFSRWEKGSEGIGHHAGILVTEKQPDATMSARAMDVYDIIAESNLRTIKSHPQSDIFRMDALCGSCPIATFSTNKHDAPPSEQEPLSITAGETLKIIKAVPIAISTDESTPYTDATLIETLLTAFEGALMDDICMFSAPIENLIQWGQVVRTNNGGLAITERGLVTAKYLAQSSLADVQKSVVWDRRLTQVVTGEAAPNTYLSDIRTYVEDLVDELGDCISEVTAMGGFDLHECCCPVCAQPVVAVPEAGWRCSNPDCKFSLPKEYKKHILTGADAGALLTNGVTPLITDFASTKQAAFAARLMMDTKHQLTLSFQSPYCCPVCGKPLSEYIWGLTCRTKEQCNFSMYTTVCGVRLSQQQIEALLAGQHTDLIKGFMRQDKRTFSAKLFLDENRQIKFE